MPTGVWERTPEHRAQTSAGMARAWAEGRRTWFSNDYSAIHKYLVAHYPKDGICVRCGPAPRTEFALIHGREYSRNREDYQEMCSPCHHAYDQTGRKR